MKHGIIRPSCSPYSVPIVPIRKKDSSLRICVDYRKLNNVTLFDAYPAPRIDELFEQLDMSKGYFQVPLSPQSHKISAFVTPLGLYEFTVMPFGMKTSAATFLRLLDKLLNDLENTVAYFDDIVAYSKSWEAHMEHLKQLFQRLAKEGITVRPTKCELGVPWTYCWRRKH